VKLGTVVFLALFAAHSSSAQAALPPQTSTRITGSFFIDPTSTSIKGGKASLIVGALRRSAGTYIGDHQLTTPVSRRDSQGYIVISAIYFLAVCSILFLCLYLRLYLLY
jgi:hypothetical protein